MKRVFLLFAFLVLCSSFVLADYSIDISGLSSDEYELGENIDFSVVLLDGDTFVDEEVTVIISDALGKKEVSKTVVANQDSFIRIGEDFPSGLWHITASVGDVSVERPFTVSANLVVEFLIETTSPKGSSFLLNHVKG